VKGLESEISKLKETLTQVLTALKNKENEIKVHEQRITCLETNAKTSSAETFQCTQCNYTSSTATALKTHITKKHKPETFRDSSTDKDLEVSLISSEGRADEPSSLFSSSCTNPNITSTYTCEICSETSIGFDTFKKHMVGYHVFKDSTETCCLCEENFPFLPTYPTVSRKSKEVEVMCSPCYEASVDDDATYSLPLFHL
jgi:hypothetical protein